MYLYTSTGSVERYRSWSRVQTLWKWMCLKVQDQVMGLGFGPFLSLPVLKADKVLRMALVKRWSSLTHTFHLLMGEIGLPPIDFYMIMGLSMGSTAPPSTNEVDPQMVRRCIRIQLMEYYKGTKGVLPSWFKKNYVWATEKRPKAEIDYSTRTFLLYMPTRSIFYGKSDQVYFHFYRHSRTLAA